MMSSGLDSGCMAGGPWMLLLGLLLLLGVVLGIASAVKYLFFSSPVRGKDDANP